MDDDAPMPGMKLAAMTHPPRSSGESLSEETLRQLAAYASDAATWGTPEHRSRFETHADPRTVERMARELLASRPSHPTGGVEPDAWQKRRPGPVVMYDWTFDEKAFDTNYREGAEKLGWEFRPLYASPPPDVGKKEGVVVTDAMVDRAEATLEKLGYGARSSVRAALTAALQTKGRPKP